MFFSNSSRVVVGGLIVSLGAYAYFTFGEIKTLVDEPDYEHRSLVSSVREVSEDRPTLPVQNKVIENQFDGVLVETRDGKVTAIGEYIEVDAIADYLDAGKAESIGTFIDVENDLADRLNLGSQEKVDIGEFIDVEHYIANREQYLEDSSHRLGEDLDVSDYYLLQLKSTSKAKNIGKYLEVDTP
jgi:hypothetical protein